MSRKNEMINDIIKMSREYDMESTKNNVCRMDRLKDYMENLYCALDCREKKVVHSIIKDERKVLGYQRQLLRRKYIIVKRNPQMG